VGQTGLCTATLSDGSASCSAVDAPLGTDTVTATYSSDSEDDPSSGTTSLTVSPDTTATAASVQPSQVDPGASVTYSATVAPVGESGTPTGTVTFTDGSDTLCSAPVASGSASCSSTAAPTGYDTITASYGGDSSSDPSTGTTSLTVTPPDPATTTTVTADPTNVVSGTPVTFSTTVTGTGGTPTGTVAITDGSDALCTATLASGTGSCSSSKAPVGNDTVTADYSGDPAFDSSSATTSLEVLDAPGVYVPKTATRICDTRAGNPSHLTGGAAQCNGSGNVGETLHAGGSLALNVSGVAGVPSGVTAIIANVTETGATGTGYFTLYPTGTQRPTASNLDFAPGGTVSNLVEVGVSSSGQVTLYSSAPANAIVDLEGYVTPSEPEPGAGLYDPLSSPARICDTRGGNPSSLSGSATQCNTDQAEGSPDNLVGPTDPLTLNVSGVGGVPTTGVEAAVLNVTETRGHGTGYLTAYPTGADQPVASNLDFTAGQTVANRVVVPVNATTGQVTIYSSSPADIIVDVSGYYTSAGGIGAEFTPALDPIRICDTRGGNPSSLSGGATQCNTDVDKGSPADPLGPAGFRTIQTAGIGDIPSGATALALNLTAVDPTTATYLTLSPAQPPPTTSDLNPPAGSILANMVVPTLTSSGTFDVYNAAGSTNLIIDVAGWYAPPADALVAALATQEPALAFTSGSSTSANQISVVASADGDSVILAAQANTTGNCWYIVDNEEGAETGSSPWSSPGAVFDGDGDWYGEVKNTGPTPICSAAEAPGGPNSSTQDFQAGSFPDL
jgi:hypothetical protein